jgi:hypothetical protein
MLENASSLGDRRLAEEALERNLLSCRSIRVNLSKTLFPMTRMADHSFLKSAILKLPKLATCPYCNYNTVFTGEGFVVSSVKRIG